MAQAQFLADLRNELSLEMNAGEIKEILRDYEELFAAGREEGKTEEQLIVQFGTPREIAHTLAIDRKTAEKGKSFITQLVQKVTLRGVVATVFILVFVECLTAFETSQGLFDLMPRMLTRDGWDIVLTILLPTLYLYSRLGSRRRVTPKLFFSDTVAKVICWAVLFLVLAYITIFILVIKDFDILMLIVNPESFARSLWDGMHWMVLLLTVHSVWMMLGRRMHTWFGNWMFVNCSLLFTLLNLLQLLSHFGEPQKNMTQAYRSLYPLAVGLIAAIVMAIYQRRKTLVGRR